MKEDVETKMQTTEETTQLNAEIATSLHRLIKSDAAISGIRLQDWVTKACEFYLKTKTANSTAPVFPSDAPANAALKAVLPSKPWRKSAVDAPSVKASRPSASGQKPQARQRSTQAPTPK